MVMYVVYWVSVSGDTLQNEGFSPPSFKDHQLKVPHIILMTHLLDSCIFYGYVVFSRYIGSLCLHVGGGNFAKFRVLDRPKNLNIRPQKGWWEWGKAPPVFFGRNRDWKIMVFLFFSKRNHGGFERNHTLQKFNSEFSPEKLPNRVSRFGKDHLPTIIFQGGVWWVGTPPENPPEDPTLGVWENWRSHFQIHNINCIYNHL